MIKTLEIRIERFKKCYKLLSAICQVYHDKKKQKKKAAVR